MSRVPCTDPRKYTVQVQEVEAQILCITEEIFFISI